MPTPLHGTLAGFERHRRANDEACELCRSARRGYEAGRRSIAAAKTPTVPRLPDELTEALLRMCRAIVLRRPAGSIHNLAAEALRAAAERQRGGER